MSNLLRTAIEEVFNAYFGVEVLERERFSGRLQHRVRFLRPSKGAQELVMLVCSLHVTMVFTYASLLEGLARLASSK